MRGWANNVWGVAYRSCTRAQNGRVNCAPFNFRTSFKASDSEPEPVFDVFLKSAARNDEVSALGRKDDLRVRYPRRANIFGVKEWRAVTSLRQTTRSDMKVNLYIR